MYSIYSVDFVRSGVVYIYLSVEERGVFGWLGNVILGVGLKLVNVVINFGKYLWWYC